MNLRIEPRWIKADTFVVAVNHSIMDHGGMNGSVKYDLLESALSRPQHLWLYEQVDSLAVLAASYAAGISQNHPFTDGNKRAALLAIGLFLKINGHKLKPNIVEAIHMILSLAEGECDQSLLSAWISQNMERINQTT